MVTLHGEMQVTETTYACQRDACSWQCRPSVLDHLVVPNRQIGIDVLLAVGLLRFALHLQREEVQAVLARRGVEIGTGSISRLGDEFLVRFRAWFEDQESTLADVMSDELGVIEHTRDTQAGHSERYQLNEKSPISEHLYKLEGVTLRRLLELDGALDEDSDHFRSHSGA